MSAITDPRFKGIDFERSYVLGVIYDDESLTLEMDFNLTEIHPEHTPSEPGEEGCYRNGFIRFADIDDLDIKKAREPEGETDYSVIHSVSGDGKNFEISCGWGEIKVTARAVRVAFD